MSLERVKVGQSKLMRRLIIMSTSVRVIDYPQIGCVQGHVTRVYAFYRMVLFLVTLRDPKLPPKHPNFDILYRLSYLRSEWR